MEKNKGLKVVNGRLLNHQPDGENVIKKITRVKKEMHMMDKVNTILRAEQLKKMF